MFRETILTMHRNLVIYFAHGVFLGFGLNVYFSYQTLTGGFSFFGFLADVLIAGSLTSIVFFEGKFKAKVRNKQKWRAILFGVMAASVILAFLSFVQNLAWFRSGGPLTTVMVENAAGGYSPLTVYPPDLMFNLLKSTFFAAVAGFIERVVGVFA
jgi:hypothetical protein